MPSSPIDWIAAELDQLDSSGLRRRLVTHEGPQQARLRVAGRDLINFGANDYLGLAADPRLGQAVQGALEIEAWGSGASPLITGHGTSHERLEHELAEFEGTESALLFASGYAANAGTITALVGQGDALFSDAKNHASIIDGCRLSGAATHIYNHADTDELRARLAAAGSYRRRLIVTDGLFSMDGDLAPLAELADVARQFDAMLLVDEAHATGVFGSRGRGVAEHLGVEADVHVRVGTLSKALGCAGGFVAGSQLLIDWLVNCARPYVYSTAQPAAGAAAAIAALQIVREEPRRRIDLLSRAERLRHRLLEQGWQVGRSTSQIIPVQVGDAEATMQLASRLYEQGLWVPGIRPPSVPPGESLLRISLSYAHTDDMFDQLLDVLGRSGQFKNR